MRDKQGIVVSTDLRTGIRRTYLMFYRRTFWGRWVVDLGLLDEIAMHGDTRKDRFQ